MPNILISGFAPFSHHQNNPSMQIAQQLHGTLLPNNTRIIGCELPVVQHQCIQLLLQKIQQYTPIIIIALGVSSRSCISLERVALNIDDFSIPDNAGNQPIDAPILHNAPPAYWSTLPIKKLFSLLQKQRIPVEISNSAGTFVCNHLFFHMQHALSSTHTQSGFIHVPTTKDIPLSTQVGSILKIATYLSQPSIL